MDFRVAWVRGVLGLSVCVACVGGSGVVYGEGKAAPVPEGVRRLLAPVPVYQLDAGASQVLLLGADRGAKTEVALTATPRDAGAPAVSCRWSVAKGPEGAVFDAPTALRTGVTFHEAGTYFLRVDVTGGKWSDWQSVVVQVVDPAATGFAANRFLPPPKAGVHPRVLMNPEELPELREHLKNSVIGRTMAMKLEINSRILRDGASGFDPKGALGKLIDGSPSIVNVGYFAKTSETYRKLVAGDMGALGTTIRDMDVPTAHLGEQLAAEGLWCLVNDDKAGAQDVAAAITTWAKIVMPTIKAEDDWQWQGSSGRFTYPKQEMGRLFDKVGRENLGLAYDFVYNYMTPEQRETVRSMISRATSGRTAYGVDQPHYVRVGNWVTFHTTALMLLALSIEGEPGYDPNAYKSCAEVFQDYYEYSVLEDGESFESLGKGGAYPLVVVPMAKRGDWVGAHPHLRNYYRSYILNCLEPYGYHYIALSTLGDSNLSGGMKVDASIAHFCYPNDRAIAEVYRNLIGENYGGAFAPTELLPLTLWGSDFVPPAGQPWEWDKSQPLTYVGRDQGLVVTRSDWSKNGLYLYFDCGSNIRDLGHYDPARNMFILSALGRNWIADTGQENSAEAHSVVTIDGKGCSKRFGKLVGVKDEAGYTSLCGDAKPAYDWMWERGDHSKGEVDPITVNDIRFAPLPERWMEMPLTYQFSFFSPYRVARRSWNPVERAYRNALLRRGAHPYVVIADDIQKDSQSHQYEFILRLAEDLENQVKVNGKDIVLSDPGTSRRMLVRVVTPGGITVTPRRVVIRTDTHVEKPTLAIGVKAVRPEYRVLFYPYEEGQPLPETVWDEAGQALRVKVGGQEDVCRFSRDKEGRPVVGLGG